MENLFESGRPEQPAGPGTAAAGRAASRTEGSALRSDSGSAPERSLPPPSAGRAPTAPAPCLGRAPATRTVLNPRDPARPHRIGRSSAPSAQYPPLRSAPPCPAVPVALTLRAAVTTPPGSAQPPAHPRTSGTRPSLPVMRGRAPLLTSGRDAAL